MTALRTTRRAMGPIPPGRRAGVARAAWLGLVLVGVAGCGGGHVESSDPAPYRPTMATLPPPASDRIECHDRTLTFYDLPASGRWMVQRDNGENYPAGPEHTLPAGADPDHTFVYYTRPGGVASRSVTLAEIQAARPAHTSQPR